MHLINEMVLVPFLSTSNAAQTLTHTPSPGHMIRKSESEKVLKHGKSCIKTNITFYAAVNDSQGAQEIIQEIIQHVE